MGCHGVFMTLLELFTRFNGRIGRQQFWLASLTLAVVVTLVGGILAMAFGTRVPAGTATYDLPFFFSVDYALHGLGAVLMPVLMLCYLWAALAVVVKRWHDRDKSGWWVLLPMIPLIGTVWAFVETGFVRGTAGANRFGPDPLGG